MSIRVVTVDDDGAESDFDISKYPTQFLECREAMRHQTPPKAKWRWSVLRNVVGEPITYTGTTQCLSCKAIVQEVIYTRTGVKDRKVHRPTLPVPYRIPKSAGVTIYELRQELMRRIPEQAIEADITDETDSQATTTEESK